MSSRSKKLSRRKRRQFSEEFKADIIRLCQTGPESVGEVCSRLDLIETTVRRWIRQRKVDDTDGQSESLSTSERVELAQLRRDNKRLKMEREILKKAAAFFAKENS